MQAQSFVCDCCGERIEDLAVPVVSYTVVGIAPIAAARVEEMSRREEQEEEERKLRARPMTKESRELLTKPLSRIEVCEDCKAALRGESLYDGAGKAHVPRPSAKSAAARFKRDGLVSVVAGNPNRVERLRKEQALRDREAQLALERGSAAPEGEPAKAPKRTKSRK